MKQEVIQKQDIQPKQQAINRTGIPTQMKQDFERRSGLSFDDVRVHYNSDRPAKLGALAYTQGNQVHIGPGQEQHLRHELGHVVQQKTRIIKATETIQGIPVNTSQELERSATQLGHIDKPNTINSISSGHIVQMYSIETNENSYGYYQSKNKHLLCSLFYPNHYFYADDKIDIQNDKAWNSDSVIQIVEVASDMSSYKKYTAKYTDTYNDLHNKDKQIRTNSLKTIEKTFEKELPHRHKKAYSDIVKYAKELKRNLEMFRKEMVYKASSSPEFMSDFEKGVKIYRDLSQLFNTPSAINKKANEFLNNIDGEICSCDEPTEFSTQAADLVTFVSLKESWKEFYKEMNTLIASGKSGDKRLTKAIKYAYLKEQESSPEPLFPRGCDLMKMCITSPSLSKDLKDPFLSSTDYFDGNSTSTIHHSTIVASDEDDFICLEGYANKNFKFFDNSWEFIMYGIPNDSETEEQQDGHKRDKKDSFLEANQLRHKLMRDNLSFSKSGYERIPESIMNIFIRGIFSNLENQTEIF